MGYPVANELIIQPITHKTNEKCHNASLPPVLWSFFSTTDQLMYNTYFQPLLGTFADPYGSGGASLLLPSEQPILD